MAKSNKRRLARAAANIYFVVLFVLFAADGTYFLQTMKVMNFSNTFFLLFCMIPVYCHELVSRHDPVGRIAQSLTRNMTILLPLTGIAALSLLDVIIGRADTLQEHVAGFKFAVYPCFKIVEFLIGAQLGSMVFVRNSLRTYCFFALSALLMSVLANSMWPDAFSNLVGMELDYSAGFGHDRNRSASTSLMLLAIALNYEKLGFRDFSALAISALTIFLTLSRQGIILYVIILIYYFYCVMKKSDSLGIGFGKIVLWFSVLAVVFSLGISYLTETDDFFRKMGEQQRLELLTEEKLGAFSDDDRFDLANRGMDLWSESPFIGYGLGFHRSSKFSSMGPHNEFLRYALDFGLIGFVLLIFYFFLGAKRFYQNRYERGLAFIMMAFLTCFFTHNLSEIQSFFFLYGILCGVQVTPHEGAFLFRPEFTELTAGFHNAPTQRHSD